jgi:hypothetical protein
MEGNAESEAGGGEVNDLEEFLKATTDGYKYNGPPDPIKMGELPTWDDGSLRGQPLMHPARKGEVVGCYTWRDYVFTPGFVKECFEASKNGENALVAYINDNYMEE